MHVGHFRYYAPLPSEGRGREFESRRARHEIKDLGEAKTPSVPVVSQFERLAEGRSAHARLSTTAFALYGAMPPACTVFSGRGRGLPIGFRASRARWPRCDGVGDGRRPRCGLGREWGVCGFTEIASPSRRKRSANRAAIKRWPNTPQGARVIEDSWCLRLAETNKTRQDGRKASFQARGTIISFIASKRQ